MGLKCICNTDVPMEVKLTDNVEYLELDKEKWVKEILKYSKGYVRTKTDDKIRNAWYDITEEIKVLENIYSQCR